MKLYQINLKTGDHTEIKSWKEGEEILPYCNRLNKDSDLWHYVYYAASDNRKKYRNAKTNEGRKVC